jgi:glycosyltransferase involved in cell wall biosynthesis
MPKVLIVIARLNVGGTAQYIGELTQGLKAHGYDVLVATGYVQGAEVEDDVAATLPLHRIESLGRKISPSDDWQARKELHELIKTYQPDLIYSHTFKAGVLTRTIKTSVPRIHAFHGHLLYEPELTGWKVRMVVVIERLLASKAKVLVTVGENVAAELVVEKVGKAANYLSIAPGVRPLELKERLGARRELGIEDEKRPIVVWMARVTAVKAPQRALDVARATPEARFLLAGGGDLVEEIKRELPSNLTYVGWQPASTMWGVADVAISTSENEGMPVALIEAQLAGIPVVAIDVGSVREVIQDGLTGYVLPEFGTEYISKVRELVASAAARESISHAAKQYSREHFAPELLIQKHLELFERVLAK